MPVDIAILVPVYNEADNIVPLAREVLAVMSGLGRPFELVFVDDASTDATWSRIEDARREDARVVGLKHARNAGQSAALWTGLRATSSAVVATIDGDLQNDPKDLPALLERLETVDFVCGRRRDRKDSWFRRLSSAVARAARQRMLRSDFADTGCALRVFKRSAMDGVFPFNGFHRVLPVLVQAAGVSCTEVPVGHRPRIAGVSKYGVWNRLGRGVYDLVGLRWHLKRRLGRETYLRTE